MFDRGPDVATFEVRNYDTVQSYIKEHNISCEWRGAFSCRSFNTPDSTKAAFAEVEILKKNDPTLGAKIQTEADATKIKEKFPWLILVPGQLHEEMNMLRAYVELNW